MTDMIAGQDIPGAGREFSKIDNLCPADQEEAPSNQPPAEMREQSLSSKHRGENRSSGVIECVKFRISFIESQIKTSTCEAVLNS
jgi:hypothetical protein